MTEWYGSDPISFRMCELWLYNNKNIYINRECTYYSLEYYRKNNDILFLKAKLVPDDKCFGKVTAFAKPLESRRDYFVLWCIKIIAGENLSSKASKVCRTALVTSLHRDLQVTTGTRKLSSVERRLKTATVVAVLWPLLPKTTWPSWNIWSKKTHEWRKLR